MIKFTIKDDQTLFDTYVKSPEFPKIDSRIKEIFTRHFNERDYKKTVLDNIKRISKKDFQIISDYNFEENDFIDVNKPNIFVIFNYRDFEKILNSYIETTHQKISNVKKQSIMIFIIDVKDFFDVLYQTKTVIQNISFSKYELFTGKMMLVSWLEGVKFSLNSEILAVIEIYNYIFNKSYELVNKLSQKYPNTKIFDVIEREETEEAKELKTLLYTFRNI